MRPCRTNYPSTDLLRKALYEDEPQALASRRSVVAGDAALPHTAVVPAKQKSPEGPFPWGSRVRKPSAGPSSVVVPTPPAPGQKRGGARGGERAGRLGDAGRKVGN